MTVSKLDAARPDQLRAEKMLASILTLHLMKMRHLILHCSTLILLSDIPINER